jgi:hypothetical protein
MDSEATVECPAPVLLFENPCYRKHPDVERSMEMQTVKTVSIPNGSMLNFTWTSAYGSGIRIASRFNEIPNPLGLSHSGIIVIDDPRNIYQLASRITGKIGEAMLKELRQNYGDIVSAVGAPQSPALFSLEAGTSAAAAIQGDIPPHVFIHALTDAILEWPGNCYVRPLYEAIPISQTKSFLKDFLGRPYEGSLIELLKAPIGLNKQERSESVFCSELAALFYKRVGIISQEILANNVIPESFGSDAGERFDLLFGKAMPDIALKLESHILDYDDEGCIIA